MEGPQQSTHSYPGAGAPRVLVKGGKSLAAIFMEMAHGHLGDFVGFDFLVVSNFGLVLNSCLASWRFFCCPSCTGI